MLSHSPFHYFPQWPTVAHICNYLHGFAIILGVQCPNSSIIDTGLKVLSSWSALQASHIQQSWARSTDGCQQMMSTPDMLQLLGLGTHGMQLLQTMCPM